MSHIKGPWRYVDFGSAGTVVTSGPVDICLLHRYREKDEQISNAKLIAAAPDLLEACRQLIECAHQEHFAVRLNHAEMLGIYMIKEAIKKATT